MKNHEKSRKNHEKPLKNIEKADFQWAIFQGDEDGSKLPDGEPIEENDAL